MNFEDLEEIVRRTKVDKRKALYPAQATQYNIRFITPCKHIDKRYIKVFFGKNHGPRRTFQIYCPECPCVYEVMVVISRNKRTGKMRPVVFWHNWVRLEPMPDIAKFCGQTLIPIASAYTVDKQYEKIRGGVV